MDRTLESVNVGGFKMRWNLKTFLIIVPLLALLLAFLIQHLFVPKPNATVSILGPITTGENALLPAPAEDLIARAIDRHYGVLALNGNKPASVLSLIKVEEMESWTEDERGYPLIGNAQMHHRLWRCEFDAVSNEGEVSRRVVHLDQNHFHLP